jgi:hypothetical protein
MTEECITPLRRRMIEDMSESSSAPEERVSKRLGKIESLYYSTCTLPKCKLVTCTQSHAGNRQSGDPLRRMLGLVLICLTAPVSFARISYNTKFV